MEFALKDQVFYHTGDLLIPARPDGGVDMRQGSSQLGPRPDNGGDAKKGNHGENDPMEGNIDRMSELDLGAWKGTCWSTTLMKRKAMERMKR